MSLQQRYEHAYEAANRHDQEHIFAFWGGLTEQERAHLITQAEQIDYGFIERVRKEKQQAPSIEGIEPPVIIEKDQVKESIINKGKQAIANGKVAMFIVAGGQGSRLGFDGPKGCYPTTPLKHKTLFQIFAEKLRARQKEFDTTIELYIMTSETNHDETVKHFEDNNYFGLDKDHVVFFKQSMYPIIDEQGKILLASKHDIAMAPSGTGGIYQALHKGNILERMKQKGITHLHYINVDNPLNDLVDPVFIGQHLFEEAEMSCKVVEKADPQEKVGVVVKQGEKAKIIEYVFMLEELLYAKDDDGKLKYRAGSFAVHIINRDFAERIATGKTFPHVLAHKKVSHINKQGERITPMSPNAYKIESFVFDALPFAENPVVMSVDRAEEFAPVKNPEGVDSIISAKNMQIAQAKRWLIAAGISKDIIERLEVIEISPLLGHTKEAFVKAISKHKDLIEQQLKGQTKAYLGN